MSLLEDIFLEDEAGEAQELERVIEGDEDDDRPRSRSDSDDNSEKEDEAEEDKKRVDPTQAKQKRIVKNPRFTLNPARLTGPRGIQVIPDHFKDFKFKGKGHEKEDLDLVLKKLEHWAYRLYPKFQFEDCLKKIETLGKKRPVMVHLQKIRSDQFMSEETVVQRDSSEDEAPVQEDDEFDKLLQQQIDLARATPAPGSHKKGFMTPGPRDDRSPYSMSMPKATSSPSISDEQRERIMRNRKLAEERRLAKLKNNTFNTSQNNEVTGNVSAANEDKDQDIEEIKSNKKTNKSFVIDSDDEVTGILVEANENNDQDIEEMKARKANKSFVIDSDDDSSSKNVEIDLTINGGAKIWDGPNKRSEDQVININDINVSNKIDLTRNSGSETASGLNNTKNTNQVPSSKDMEIDLTKEGDGKIRNGPDRLDQVTPNDSNSTTNGMEIDLTDYSGIKIWNGPNSHNKTKEVTTVESNPEHTEIDLTENTTKELNTNQVANVIDITEGYKCRNKTNDNHRDSEIVDLVDTEVKDTDRNTNLNESSSDDECDLESVNVSVLADVHTSRSDIQNSIEKETQNVNSERNSIKETNNERNGIKETDDYIKKENESLKGNSELIDKENIDCNGENGIDLMDVDFSDDF